MSRYHYLFPFYKFDLKMIPLLLALMTISILVIASTDPQQTCGGEQLFLSPYVKGQIKWFSLGSCIYLASALFDYRKLREWVWPIYIGSILLLIGLFFTETTREVHRWYRIPFLHIKFQPTDCVKLSLILTLSWLLEKERLRDQKVLLVILLTTALPFYLILQQPDLGGALVLIPITLGMLYFCGSYDRWLRRLFYMILPALIMFGLLFCEIIPHERLRPLAQYVLADYQYDRLKPQSYHHKAAKTAIALGGLRGQGWRRGGSGEGFLPEGRTDSVFPAFVEQFGLWGAVTLLTLFLLLIYRSLRIGLLARDRFGSRLACGIALYLSTHVLLNISMMCGLLPITGIPLLLITYGGSSIVTTMAALGLLQSIHVRRFTF